MYNFKKLCNSLFYKILQNYSTQELYWMNVSMFVSKVQLRSIQKICPIFSKRDRVKSSRGAFARQTHWQKISRKRNPREHWKDSKKTVIAGVVFAAEFWHYIRVRHARGENKHGRKMRKLLILPGSHIIVWGYRRRCGAQLAPPRVRDIEERRKRYRRETRDGSVQLAEAEGTGGTTVPTGSDIFQQYFSIIARYGDLFQRVNGGIEPPDRELLPSERF